MAGCMPYVLSATLLGHSKDVRCVAWSEEGSVLISGSRDFTARQWNYSPPNHYNPGLCYAGHGNFVSSLCVIPTSRAFPHPVVATGCTDSTIRLFTLDAAQPFDQLTGHSANVSALKPGPHGMLVSGSWDTTVKQWVKRTCVGTLTGHEAAVWDVAVVPEVGHTLSASADKTIKAWSAGKCVQTYSGHTDCVRGLAVLSSAEFASCANDATVRVWAVASGDCLAVLYGHTNYIYSIAVFPSGQLVTSSEDRTVKVWDKASPEEPLQSLALPCQSVWTVTALPNGDLAVGGSDATIRIFSRDPARAASEEQVKFFEEEVASASVPSKSTIGDLKIDELPGPEALLAPGRREGQTMMVREGKDTAFCYQWSSAKQQWDKVGQVLGGSGGTQVTSGKQLHHGKEYDYVFSVELTEGHPPLKLPYNVTEDPWHAARNFLLANDLDPLFLDQVANFIIQNTAGVQLGTSGGNPDPFTGSSGPTPSGRPSVPTKEAPRSSIIGNFDPFTGNAGNDSVSNGDVAPTTYFPLKECVVLFKSNYAKDVEKILEFNLRTNHPVDADTAQRLVTGSYSPENADLVLKSVLTWEADLVFPFLDISVGFVAHQEFASALMKQLDPLLQRIAHFQSSAGKPTQTMSIRLLANLSGTQTTREELLKNSKLSSIIESYSKLRIPLVSVALATLVMNICVDSHLRNTEISLLEWDLPFSELLSSDNPDEETCFRTLVAVGTVVSNCEIMKDAVKSTELVAICQQMLQKTTSIKVKECGNAVMNALK